MPTISNSSKPFKNFSHAPTITELEGVKAEIKKNGQVILSKDNGDDTFDEIITSAAFIYRLASMLSAGKKVTYSDKPYSNSSDE